MKTESTNKKHRLTVTFPKDIYIELETISLSQDVSIAWLVRKAVGQYISPGISLRPSSSEKELIHGKG